MLHLFADASSNLALNLPVQWWHWALLGGWFLFLILVDIFVFHKKDHEPSLKSAAWQSAAWIALGISLGIAVWQAFGGEAAGQYFSGYVVEKSLSIDNVFTWALILSYLRIPKKYQHRVLFWGVIGAIILRVIFVFAGIALIDRFEPVLIIFGLILLWSGFKLLKTDKEHEYDPRDGKIFSLITRAIPVSHHLDGHKLFTKENGKFVATMLFVALLMVEFTDIVFAVDSVPAILAVSQEPFIIIASNAAAILGMRALYFVFDILKETFWLLNHALAFLLLFVGLKLFIAPSEVFNVGWFDTHIATNVSLLIISGLLASGLVGSIIFKKPEKQWVKRRSVVRKKRR